MKLIPTWGIPALLCVTGLSALGCGGAALPVRDQADAVAAVRSARELGAEHTPQAAYHLGLADQQVAQADTLVQQGQNSDAQRLYLRAKADAELAVALEREAIARSRAIATHEHLENQRDSQLRTDGN